MVLCGYNNFGISCPINLIPRILKFLDKLAGHDEGSGIAGKNRQHYLVLEFSQFVDLNATSTERILEL